MPNGDTIDICRKLCDRVEDGETVCVKRIDSGAVGEIVDCSRLFSNRLIKVRVGGSIVNWDCDKIKETTCD